MRQRDWIEYWPRWLVALVVSLAGFALVTGAREAGFTEKTELGSYDHLLGARPPAGDGAPALILETEADLQRLGHPLPDGVIAELVERVLAAAPLAVIVDKYRDVPVEPGTERLAALLRANDRIFWVRKIGDEKSTPVRAPREIEGTPFAACGDTVEDADGRVRRQLVYIDDAKEPCYSLAFSAARRVLEAKGAKSGFDKDGALLLGERRLEPLEAGAGPYATADFAGFQLPVEYAPRRLDAVTLSDALEGRVAPEAFRGRVVLFGSSAESLRDFFNVPAARHDAAGRITGVEVHAAALATLLDAATAPRPLLRLAPRWATWTLIATAAGLTAFLLLMVPRWGLATLIVVGAGAGIYALARVALTQWGLFISFVPGLVAIGVTGLLAFALRAWREQAERSEMLGLFSRQISREVADAIWAQRETFYRNGKVPTQQLAATVFFLDIRSFTTYTEKLGPGTVPWLNRGLSVMTDTVIKHHGVVTRFVGDQIMAVYGVPVPRADDTTIRRDARAAVSAAVEIRDQLTALNREFESEGLPPIRVRIGINSGTLTQGAVGSSLRFEFTVLGDVVNTAARLESYATEDDGSAARVLIGESTYKLCGEHFRCEALGAVQLKGKLETVAAYRVIAANPHGAET